MDKRKRVQRKCFNPFKEDKPCQKKNTTDLRLFTEAERRKIPTADDTCVLCSACRKLLSTYEPAVDNTNIMSQVSVESLSLSQATFSHGTVASQGAASNFSDSMEEYNDHSLELFLNVSPVKKKRITSAMYASQKLEQIHERVNKKFSSQFAVLPKMKSDEIIEDHMSMLANIKQVYGAEISKSTRLKLLSVLPDSWDISRVQNEFNCSRFNALHAKKVKTDLKNDESIKLRCLQRPGNQPLNEVTKKLVIDFYENDTNSRQLSGMRDVKSVKEADGTRKNVQKKLLLSNIRELYCSFKSEYPTVDIKFAKFARLRPQHCVIAGSSGTHTVCVCTIHQNVKLMLEGCKFLSFDADSDWLGNTNSIYDGLLRKLVCDSPNECCYLRTCEQCPNGDEIIQFFEQKFDEKNIAIIEYKKGTATDRCTIINISCETEEFIYSLMERLKLLLTHDYIAKSQSRYFVNAKKNLKSGEFVVTLDFAENFAFIVQEAAQAFHYNNDQATLLPIVIYYYENEEIKHCSFVGVTDCLKHDYVSVHLFQKELIKFLKTKFSDVKKILYFSDGAPQQFKNKNAFTNLSYHYHDFKIEAEWNFFATAHGKGPCDGLAGAVKRLARKASLQMGTRDEIVTPDNLFQWAKKSLPNIHFEFIKNEEYLEMKEKLDARTSQSKTVRGTQSQHFFSPIQNNMGTIVTKTTSSSVKFSMSKIF